MTTVAVLGTGAVGRALAAGLRDLGHTVVLGSRTGKEVDGWDGATATFAEAAAPADLAVLAVKGSVAEELVRSLAGPLEGTVVLDTTNPISDQPPTDGVLSFFTDLDGSLMERLQRAAPGAHFVKAFNSVGNARMVHPAYGEGLRPTMFVAGDDEGAKARATEVVTALGWDVEDMGPAAAARAIEPLCILWCITGFREGTWTHALKLLRD